MTKLKSICVVNDHEDEEQGIYDEVLLAVVSHLLIVLTCLLVDLDWCNMDRLIAAECNTVPNRDEEPEA